MVEHLRFGVWRFAAALAIFAALGLNGLTSVSAQDASPTPVECVSPGLAPGTPTAMDDMAEMEMGTPEASPAAVETTPMPEGTAADEATAAAIIAAIENYAACYTEGQASGDPGLYVSLESAAFLARGGYTTPYDRVAEEIGSPFASATLVSIEDPMTYADGRASADIEYLLGDHFFNHSRVFLSQDGDLWKWDEEVTLRPEPEAETVSVNGILITETTDEATGQITYAFESTSGSFDYAPAEALILNFTNQGVEAHEAIVAQLPDGADPLGLLDGSVPFEDVKFIGVIFDILPGQTADLALLNLPPGTYTLLCFFPGPDGAPHAANGMVQNFNVVAPAG